jgi:hypothetical protein
MLPYTASAQQVEPAPGSLRHLQTLDKGHGLEAS